MTYRQNHSPAQAAAKAGISRSSAYRIEKDPMLGSRQKAPRRCRRRDPLACIFDEEVIPILHSAPAIRPVAVFEELLRRHPSLSTGIRRTLESRIRQWLALHGPEQELIFRQSHSRDAWACPISLT